MALLGKLVVISSVAFTSAAVSPVVIIPGDGSNQLEAKFNKPSKPAWYCSSTSDWFRLWLDLGQLIGATTCWSDTIKLLYDESADSLSNNLGVETRVPFWGETTAFEELDPAVPFHKTGAFYKMVKALVSAGHTKNVTLRGAPYDFRYAPSSPVGAKFIENLKTLIEETSRANGQRVSLISHSMGCLQVHYLLQVVSQAWKDEFVERWIPISGPFGGSAEELKLHASGNNEGLPVKSLTIREEQRSYETNFWMLPVPGVFGEQTLVSTPTRNYSAHDYDNFFDDIGFSAGKKLYNRTKDLTSRGEPPGVDVFCMYSLSTKTALLHKYDGGNFDEDPQIIYGDGDGTVNLPSLALCEHWTKAGAQTRKAAVMRFENITHSDMIMSEVVFEQLFAVLGLKYLRPPVSTESVAFV